MAKKIVTYREALFLIGFCAALFAIYAVTTVIPRIDTPGAAVRMLLSFVSVGVLVGVILVFDAQSSYCSRNRPVIRLVAGALSAALIGAVWQLAPDWHMLVTLLGSVLGLMGMVWLRWMEPFAKHL